MTPEQDEALVAYIGALLSALGQLEGTHRDMAHSGIDGVCRCPRCIGCKTLLSADRVCLNCAPEPDEVWGLGGSLPDPAQAAELAQCVFDAQFPPGAPERYAPARYLTAPPRHGAEREPNSQTKEDDLVPTPLIAEAGSRGYRAMPVDITAVGIWTGVITIEAPTATGRSRGAVRRFYSDSTNRIRAALSASPSAKKPHSPSCATSPPPCGSSALPGTSATCGCRKLCRGWSGGISVLIDESVTAGRSHDLEVSIWLVWRVGGDGWSLVE